MDERDLFKKQTSLAKMYKERDEISKNIAEAEMVLEGEGFWCSRCGNFVAIIRSSVAYSPDHSKEGLCYSCGKLEEMCANRDRLLKVIKGSTVIDLKPLSDDGDYIEWIMFKSPNGEMWRYNYRDGKLDNLRHITIKERR